METTQQPVQSLPKKKKRGLNFAGLWNELPGWVRSPRRCATLPETRAGPPKGALRARPAQRTGGA